MSFVSSRLDSSELVPFRLVSSHLSSSHLFSSHLIPCHLVSAHLISAQLISSHLIFWFKTGAGAGETSKMSISFGQPRFLTFPAGGENARAFSLPKGVVAKRFWDGPGKAKILRQALTRRDPLHGKWMGRGAYDRPTENRGESYQRIREDKDFATSFDAEGSIARQVDVTRCVRQTRGKQRRQLSKDSRGQRSTLGSATMPFGESNMNSRKVRFGRRTIRARRIFCDQL